MTPTKPYLIRALYEWCVDEGFTPYLDVSVNDRTRVPREYVRDGKIVLNIGPEATQKLQMGNGEITFQARFGGVAFAIAVPVGRVSAIYARENGEGMGFEVSSEEEVPTAAQPPAAPADEEDGTRPPPPSGRPHLTRIK